MKDLVSHQLVRYLEHRGVEHIFGLCGHTNIAVLTALTNSPIKFINVRHEQIAAHAADAYARIRKKASVVLSHLGPGLTNAATGVANAALDSIPMVVIAGDVPSHFYGKHPHQEINLHADAAQWEVFRPFVKRAWRVERPDLFPQIIAKAFQLAESGRPGPVLVSVPMDIFSASIDVDLFERVKPHTSELKKPALAEEVAKQIVVALGDAERPVIYAGGGVLIADASDELAAFADHMSIPVAHSLMGKGVIPDDHPMTLGMTGFWGTQFVNDNCRTADFLLGLGTSFKEADSSSWENDYTFDIPKTKLIQIDIDPSEIGRNYPAEIGAVADLKHALTALNTAARQLYPGGRKNDPLREEHRALPCGVCREQFRSTKGAISSRCVRNASSLTREPCFPATRSSQPMWVGIRTGSASSFRSTRLVRFSRQADTLQWASALQRRLAPKLPLRIASSCRSSEMAASVKIHPFSRPPLKKTSRWFGS